MPEPQEQDPAARRFERIEAALEFLAGSVAGIAVTQQKIEEAQLRTEFSLTQAGEQINKLAAAQTTLAAAQTKSEEHIDALAIKSAESQGKLDALIDVVDKWIREHGAKNGAPPPEPPPA